MWHASFFTRLSWTQQTPLVAHVFRLVLICAWYLVPDFGSNGSGRTDFGICPNFKPLQDFLVSVSAKTTLLRIYRRPAPEVHFSLFLGYFFCPWPLWVQINGFSYFDPVVIKLEYGSSRGCEPKTESRFFGRLFQRPENRFF